MTTKPRLTKPKAPRQSRRPLERPTLDELVAERIGSVEPLAQPSVSEAKPSIATELLDPRDAWCRVGEVMVRRALAKHQGLAEAARQPSAIIFVEVDAEWLHWVADAWGRCLFPDAPEDHLPGCGDDWELMGRTPSHSDDPLWLEYRREVQPKAARLERSGRGLAWAVGRGLPVFGFAPSLDCLPRDFPRVYERHVVIPPSTAR
jgi:hypothetical protein